VEAYPFTQVEGEGSGVGLIPTLGEGGGEVEIRIVGYEAIEDQLGDVFRLAVGADAGIEAGWTAVDEEDDRVGVALRGSAGGEKQD
jgi:hypothetical protein